MLWMYLLQQESLLAKYHYDRLPGVIKNEIEQDIEDRVDSVLR